MPISESYIALGLMSGTSLDGVDAAFLETDGSKVIQFGPSLSLPYTETDKNILQEAVTAALDWQFEGPWPDIFLAVEAVLHRTHKQAVESLCETAPEWADQLALIGFHGQTVLHHPPLGSQKGQTLQLGNGQILAESLGLPVVYDFRSADVTAGGQGAPLAPIYHKALLAQTAETQSTAVLNIGGVGNVTIVEDTGRLMASDTGPGNGPLDNWMMYQGRGNYDAGGECALQGTADENLISQWLEQDFFTRQTPRSADRYDFDVRHDMAGLSVEDGAATLAAYCVSGVQKSLRDMKAMPQSLIVCGGGRHNRAMMDMLKAQTNIPVKTAEDMGWDSDFIEAQAFAFLAVRSMLGEPLSYPQTTGVSQPLTGGLIALP